MNVTLSDFKIKASPSSTAHGRVTFKVRNSADMDRGKSKSLTLNLSAGDYVLICNIGQHYRAGMRTNFTVR